MGKVFPRRGKKSEEGEKEALLSLLDFPLVSEGKKDCSLDLNVKDAARLRATHARMDMYGKNAEKKRGKKRKVEGVL